MTRRGPVVSAAAVTTAVGIGLVAAWAWPPLAVLSVWPFLLLVPGWAVVGWGARGGARLPTTGRLGLAVVLSVAITTHLAWWLSTLAGGYERWTVFAVAAVGAAPLPLAAWRAAERGGVPTWTAEAARRVRRAFRRPGPGMALGLATAALVGGVLARGLWQVHAAGVDVGGANWSDLGVHLSIAQSVNAGNFPPDVPYFAGKPLVYHWFADFGAALMARAAGLFAVPAFVVQSAVLAGALALVAHGLILVLVRDRSARRAAVLGAVVLVVGGGFGWVRLVGDLTAGLGGPWELITTFGYDNQWLTNWPYFRIPSVLTTGLLVHRATTAGLPLLAGAVLLLVVGLPTARQRLAGRRDGPRLVLLAGLGGALLAPFHFFFFPVLPLLALGWAALGGRLGDRAAPRLALLFGAPYVLALPVASAALGQAAGSGSLRLVAGWSEAPWADGPAAVLFFYATNLGIPFGLAILALAQRRVPDRGFLAFWLAALFLIPNVVQVSYVGFDMNKYFQAMWIAVAILGGWMLARWPRALVAGVLVVSVASPLLHAAHTAFSRNFLMSADQLAAAEWIASHTPERSVFVTDDWIIAPTDPAGRLRLTSFGPYVANLGFDPTERLAQIRQIQCGGDPSRSAALMRQLNASYLIARPLVDCEAPVDFAASPLFAQVYEKGSVRIFHLSSGP